MITTLNAIDAVYMVLATSPLKTAINGGIYRRRPLNSTKEDVVINSPTLNAQQLQEGLVNVNIHVPNITISVGGVQDSTQPNNIRLQQLVDLATPVLTDVWTDVVTFTVQQVSGLIEEQESNSHYLNIRLLFYAVNV